MKKFWNWLGRTADGISLGQIIGSFGWMGAVTWAVAEVKAIAALGWGAVFLVGIAFACTTILILMAALALFRVFRPLPSAGNTPPIASKEPGGADHRLAVPVIDRPPVPASAFDPKGLYVGWMQATTDHAEQERIIEIFMRTFNATGDVLAIRKVEGAISCWLFPAGGGAGAKLGPLPPPRIKTEVFRDEAVANFSDFALVLEQRITTDFLAALSKASAGYSIHLMLDGLHIYVEPDSIKGERTRLPLWSGIALRHSLQLGSGQIITASMNATG